MDILSRPQCVKAEWRVYASANYTAIATDNAFSPVGLQTIIWMNAG